MRMVCTRHDQLHASLPDALNYRTELTSFLQKNETGQELLRLRTE